jgi:NAD(P)-dependent dehydrogenase (short-subunit alcohol dehydrogenase family)
MTRSIPATDMSIDSLAGKVALITGAGTGMGRAAMARFAAAGATVIGAGRTETTLADSVAAVRAAGGDGRYVIADVGTEAGARGAIGFAEEEAGGLDILINNASVGWAYEQQVPGSMAATADAPAEAWRDVVRINLESVHLMCHYAIPALRRRGGGSIVNVSSVGGLRGMADAHAYAAAKAGVVNLTRSLARTYGPEQIRSNCFAPGVVDTGMIDPYRDTFETMLADPVAAAQLCPLGRMGTVDEAAEAMFFLATAGYCNGSVLVMDGGSSA